MLARLGPLAAEDVEVDASAGIALGHVADGLAMIGRGDEVLDEGLSSSDRLIDLHRMHLITDRRALGSRPGVEALPVTNLGQRLELDPVPSAE